MIPARELVERFSIAPEALEEHLSLLNLVNFGGGCYAVYAELHGDEVHVDKELFGDTFRGPPRLTPLEARAIRLALEFVGPMIAAGAHSPLDRVRAKLEETFGVFELTRTPTPHGGAEEDLVATLTRAIAEHRVVELEYLKPESTEVTTRTVEPYTIERRLPHWYVHTWDVDRDAPRSYRLDRTRKAKALRRGFTPRDGFDPAELQQTTTARIWYSPEVARWEVEKGAVPLVDGAAVSERAVGSLEWLVGEVLSFRGEAVILEPVELRARVAARARELERELRPAKKLAPQRSREARLGAPSSRRRRLRPASLWTRTAQNCSSAVTDMRQRFPCYRRWPEGGGSAPHPSGKEAGNRARTGARRPVARQSMRPASSHVSWGSPARRPATRA